jgi:hypothetical protein
MSATENECGMGNYSAAGDLSCTMCPAGYYSSVPIQSRTSIAACSQCGAGYYCIAGSPSATQFICPPGFYCLAGAQPVRCTAGYFCQAGSVSATENECGMGSYSAAGDLSCTLCAAGNYSSVKIAASRTSIAACSQCLPGQFSTNGSTTCTLCLNGTWSSIYGRADGCIPCRSGTYLETRGAISDVCVPCLPGRFSAVRGADSSKTCKFCTENTFSTVSDNGAANCTQCPNSATSPKGSQTCSCSKGFILSPLIDAVAGKLTSCQICKNGTVSQQVGLDSLGTCEICNAGSYCALGIQNPCPSGSWSSAFSLENAAQCTSCSNGTFSASSGQSINACIPCSSGYFSGLGAPLCTACEPGYANPRGASISRAACIPCAIGTFNGDRGQAVCLAKCQPGSNGTRTGGINETDACALCVPGTYSAFEGASICSPCASGSYTNISGSIKCTLCPKGTYLTKEGSVTHTDCLECTGGFSTVSAGSPSVGSCSTPFTCPDFTQKKILTPTSIADCAPLSCSSIYPFLGEGIAGNGCTGCTQGSSGTVGNCGACPYDALCPGFLPVPLPLDSSVLSGASKNTSLVTGTSFSFTLPVGEKKCVAAVATQRVVIALTQPPFSFTSLTSVLTIITATSFIVLMLLTAMYIARRTRRSKVRRLTKPRSEQSLKSTSIAMTISAIFKQADAFAFDHLPVSKMPQIFRPTMMGAFCNVTGAIVFLTAVTLIVLRFAGDNSVLTSALDSVTLTNNPFSASVPWASPLADAGLVPFLAASTSVQVRVFAQRELGCYTTLTWAANDEGGGAWVKDPGVADCGAGDGRSLLTFSCIACSFSSTSSLTFTLPFSCQALFVEVIAVDAIGTLQSVALPASVASAVVSAEGSALLNSVSWSVGLEASFYNDKIAVTTARGFRLLQGASTAIRVKYAPNALLLPLPAAVTVKIELPLQLAFSATTLTTRQTLVELLISIVGLVGIMGAFRFLFIFAESAALCLGCKRQPSPVSNKETLNNTSPLATTSIHRSFGALTASPNAQLLAPASPVSGFETTDDGSTTSMINPLHSSTTSIHRSFGALTASPNAQLLAPASPVSGFETTDDGSTTSMINPLHSSSPSLLAATSPSLLAATSPSLFVASPSLLAVTSPSRAAYDDAVELISTYIASAADNADETPATTAELQRAWQCKTDFESRHGEKDQQAQNIFGHFASAIAKLKAKKEKEAAVSIEDALFSFATAKFHADNNEDALKRLKQMNEKAETVNEHERHKSARVKVLNEAKSTLATSRVRRIGVSP